MKLTKEQVNKRYKDKYVDIYRTYDFTKGQNEYEVRGTSKVIKENMTLGQDVGTEMEYRR